MKTFLYPERGEWSGILARPARDAGGLEALCREVFEAVRTEGDAALRRYTKRFDGVEILRFEVSDEEFDRAAELVPGALKEAIRLAARNIEEFHRRQMPGRVEWCGDGVRCWQEPRAIEKVGLYVPAGSAPLFSTVLMLAIPARLAGCREAVLCSPPAVDGSVDPVILWTARLCGVRRVFRAGGVQAVAAMTFGTQTIPAVYKIFGPGNRFVTAAKQLAGEYGVATDMPAGPSEAMVVADRSARPAFVAADLLSQAEHGSDSQLVLVTWDEAILPAVMEELESRLARLPRREIARRALASSCAVVVRDRAEALEAVNTYAPEHLILAVEDAEGFARGVSNAGSVFLGNYTPESAGDYASGTNHTLPTDGWARVLSGVNMDAFVRKVTFQQLSREGLRRLGPAIMTMAGAEGLTAHADAVAVRLCDDGPR